MSRIYKFLEDGLFYRDLNNKDYIQYSVDEALDELEELKRDVKRYFELINSDEWMGGELENLREEIILKVGEQNE